jgi:hypothetical protein
MSVIRSSWWTTFLPGNRGLPVKTSANMQPMLHISIAGVYCKTRFHCLKRKVFHITCFPTCCHTILQSVTIWVTTKEGLIIASMYKPLTSAPSKIHSLSLLKDATSSTTTEEEITLTENEGWSGALPLRKRIHKALGHGTILWQHNPGTPCNKRFIKQLHAISMCTYYSSLYSSFQQNLKWEHLETSSNK